MAAFIIIGIIAILVVICIGMYNGLVEKRDRVRNSWKQIEVQLERRIDLVPDIVKIVERYEVHEKSTFDEIISAETRFMNAAVPDDMLAANDELSKCLEKLLALSETYPAIKANENFIDLQRELAKTEDRIAFSRQFYNDVVIDLNNAVQMFPSNIFAQIFGFRKNGFYP